MGRDDEPSEASYSPSAGDEVASNTSSAPFLARIRHAVFGTSPFAKDLRSYALSKKASSMEKSLLDGKVSESSASVDDLLYLYDIWTRILGPTTFQDEMLSALHGELFLLDVPHEAPSTNDQVNIGGLPVFMQTIQ